MASLLDKKVKELTAEDIKALAKPVGIEHLPYPMVTYAPTGKNGEMEQQIGIIDSINNPMVVYTEMSAEKVQGKLFREMPIPSMLLMLRDLLAKQAPSSKNRIFTVFGDPAFGKSFLFKSVASIVHPQGAIQVDCGGMNMREIFFRTVIDYGAGVQEALDKKMEAGKVSPETIEYLNEEFPGSVITKDDKSVIDWARIGARKTEKKGDKEVTTEDRGAAMERSKRVMENVYNREKITHLSNSFGIKTVPGEFFEAIRSGRPLFLDEFNKSKRGTLDSWQTALQFLNGEESSVTIYNPMSQSGSDDTLKAITVSRDDIKPGFFVGVAGNETIDGDTTQELSESMMTRLNPMYVGDPTLRDWEHRISQIWTGLPLVTLYHLFQDFAHDKPEEFAQAMIDLRKLGLSQHEIAAIPNKEIYFLQNFAETVKAVKQVAAYYDFRHQLGDPESKLFDKKDKNGKSMYGHLADEINSDARAKQIGVSFRKCIANHNRAVESSTEARQPGKSMMINLQAAFKDMQSFNEAGKAPGWHRFGANLSSAIVEDIINVTKDMPQTRAALIAQCTANGIIPTTFKEGKPSGDAKALPDLLKYDELKDLGGTDELKAIQGVLATSLRSMYPKLTAGDDQLIPLENLGKALKQLGDGKEQVKSFFNKAAGADQVKQVIIPNSDLNKVAAEPLVAAQAIAVYNTEEAGQDQDLVDADFREVLAAMAIPGCAEENREQIWLDDLLDLIKRTEGALPETDAEKDSFDILMGCSKNEFNLALVSAADTKGETVYLYVLEDKHRSKTMIVGPEEIAAPLLSALEKNGIIYVSKAESGTKSKIDKFLEEGSLERCQKGTLTKVGSSQVVENLIHAIGGVSELPKKHLKADPKNSEASVIKEGATLGGIIVDIGAPNIYTRLVKRAQPGR